MQDSQVLGIDVGASGIKGAIVDVQTGKLLMERVRLDTPKPATPEAMSETFVQLVRHFNWTGIIGCGFPTLVRDGIALAASNLDQAWVGKNIESVFEAATGSVVKVLNDADAAGMAETRFGLGKGTRGTVILITIGSGLGSALFVDGKIVPNTEFGHLYLKGQDVIAERYASSNAKDRDELSWKAWAKRFDEYLHHLNFLFSPKLFILGGGLSKNFKEYVGHFTVPTQIVPAQLLNTAGIVGAACYAYETVYLNEAVESK